MNDHGVHGRAGMLCRPQTTESPMPSQETMKAAMQAYIDWELHLVAQLANDSVSNFHVV